MSQQARNFIRVIILLLFSYLPMKTTATHIVGGELNYRYLGNNIYQISLTVYRDCYNGVPPFDDPASVGFFNAITNVFIREKQFSFIDLDTVPPTVNSPCFIPPTDVCYERTVYTDTVILPPSPGGYLMTYQRCCRNVTIANIIAPDVTGASYVAWMAGTAQFAQNSNPVFNNWPPPFVCAGIPFVFDHSAFDYEGDSIAYQLITPYDGGTTNNPMPQPPFNPPYNSINWNPPYSVNNMIGGTPPMSIDPQTGLITAMPMTLGQFVIGVIAIEYRGGVAVGYTRRDFQLNVVPCPTLVVAALQNPLIRCGSNTVSFQNLSFNAGTYAWDFGVPGISTDVSNQISPSYTYPDTGQYTVTLIAYSALDPGCADTTTGVVTILEDYTPGFFYSIDSCTNTVTFSDTSNSISGTTISRSWTFGDGNSSTQASPVHSYLSPGTYQVRLIATSSRGCIDTVIKSVVIPPLLRVTQQNTQLTRCFGECNGSSVAVPQNGVPPFTYAWDDPLLQNTATADSLCPGTYIVVVTDQRGCIARDSVTITQPQPLTLQLTSSPDYCDTICGGSATALPAGGNGGFSYLWNDPAAQTTSTADRLCPGVYTVLVTDQNGCTATLNTTVGYKDSVPAIDITATDIFIYQGQTTQLNSAPVYLNGNYSWTPVAGLNNPLIPNPVASPIETTTYIATYTDINGCVVTDSLIIEVRQVLCEEPEIFIPTGFSPNGDQKNDVLYVRGNSIERMYLALYNRWGELVFESTNKDIGWNGTFKGKPATADVYTYYLEIICFDKSEFKKQGNITLLK